MERYLKLVKMKSGDGKILVPPSCCIACSKKVCPISCSDWHAAMKDLKCTQVEMEFGLVDGARDIGRKYIRDFVLLVMVGCIPFLLWLISKEIRQNCDVSVERYALGTAYGTEFKVSYSGRHIDTNQIALVVNKAIRTMSNAKGGTP